MGTKNRPSYAFAFVKDQADSKCSFQYARTRSLDLAGSEYLGLRLCPVCHSSLCVQLLKLGFVSVYFRFSLHVRGVLVKLISSMGEE